MIDLKRQEGENEEQFIWRLGFAKDSGELDLDWDEIAGIINKEFRDDEFSYRDESSYRKRYSQAKQFYEAGVFKDLAGEQYVKQIREEQIALRKLKQQLSDERVDYQRTVREQARRESFVELIERVMEKHIEPFKVNHTERPSGTQSDDDMIVCLSDLHTGIYVDNHWNQYDTTIMRNRLANYAAQVIDIQQTHKCKHCEVVLAGDEISGLIHTNLRLENNEDVISQVKIATIAIGQFIEAIRGSFDSVRVHAIAGNHSRVTPNKEDHLKGENLDELIPFSLSLMFKYDDMVEICEDGMIDESINSFTTHNGKLFYVVHGDKDTPDNAVSRLTLMTGVKPDGIIMAHRHHNAFDTQYKVKVIQTGCVVGTDSHCVDLRIVGEPEQAVVISSATRTVKCYYDVGLENSTK